MKYLLDTHVLIWFIEDNKRLSKEFKEIISDPENFIFISAVCIWELIIKENQRKLRLRFSPEEIINVYKFPVLDVKMQHVLELRNLPYIHKDPFDRMLVAQTKVEGFALLTADKKIMKYFKS